MLLVMERVFAGLQHRLEFDQIPGLHLTFTWQSVMESTRLLKSTVTLTAKIKVFFPKPQGTAGYDPA